MTDNRQTKCSILEKFTKIAAERIIPISILFELTHRCNLKCRHCYIVPNGREKELTLEEIKEVLDQLAEVGCLFLNLTGGEILTRKDFFSIARYARTRNFALRLLTNGTLITPEVADKITELQPIEVDISLYGAHPTTHEAITQVACSFSLTVQAFRELKKRNITTVMKCVLMRQNIGEYKEILQLATELGAKPHFDPNLTVKNDGSKDPILYRASNGQLEEFFSDEEINPDFKEFEEKRVDVNQTPCNAGTSTCTITPYGDVLPCVQIIESAGNLRNTPFDHIWKFSKVLRKYRAIKISDLSSCTKCDLFRYCLRCQGQALLEDGDLFGPSSAACRIVKMREKISRNRRCTDLDSANRARQTN